MATTPKKANKATRKINSKPPADCLIVTYPDGTDNYYTKGENCKGWQDGGLMQPIPLVVVHFKDGSYLRFVGHPYRVIVYSTKN